uniref:DUF5824 domain-containing protein n=1 Tax=viral metagenome TaxID=1070528 RepID=A0A6C0D2G4_9ZZZZ
MNKIPKRYIPRTLSRKDRIKQRNNIMKSRRLYKRHTYYTRPKVKSFKSRPSGHVATAKRLYNIDSMKPSPLLAKRTRCSLKSLKKIVNKGEGAYYSSGSRPNQTAESWGIARLASAISGGPSSKIDYDILKEGCSGSSKALRLAIKK